ncbi:MAG: hypothetical protein ACLT2I_06815 [Corynebacterium variabile]|uniref:hypothetical protein n=1 Tax=Corynebacterium variabile TaxID=1727 RepID=UPI00289EC654|nr:hypothetical protein [Corynebacterium variabile]
MTGWLTGLSLLAAVGVSAGIGVAQDNSAGSGTTAAPVDAGTTGSGTGSSTRSGSGSGVQLGTGSGRVHTESRGS